MQAVGNWYASVIDPSDNGSSWPTLNATGLMSDPETARWSNGAFTEPQARQIIVRVCNLAGVTPPTLAVWNGWNKAQKYAWLSTTRQQLYQQSGIWLDLADNQEKWDSPQVVLDQLNLKVRQAEIA